MIMNSSALFSENKLSLILNKEETQLLKMIKDGLTFGSLNFTRNNDKKPVSISIDNKKAKINVRRLEGGDRIACSIDIKIEGTLEETNGFSGSVTSLSNELEIILKKQIMTLLNKLKDSNLDPFRLEMHYWSNTVDFMPTKIWLTEMLPNINFVVNPKIDIVHIGTIGEK